MRSGKRALASIVARARNELSMRSGRTIVWLGLVDEKADVCRVDAHCIEFRDRPGRISNVMYSIGWLNERIANVVRLPSADRIASIIPLDLTYGDGQKNRYRVRMPAAVPARLNGNLVDAGQGLVLCCQG